METKNKIGGLLRELIQKKGVISKISENK